MPTFTQPKNLADLLLTEVQPGWTKDTALYASGASYDLGTVLAKVGGKLRALDPAATDGGEVAVAIAAEAVDATGGDRKGVAIARGAVVNLDELVWPAAITDVQKTAALAALEARGIVARSAL